jgi:EmrB/QacA subfamily drug resistance transporter
MDPRIADPDANPFPLRQDCQDALMEGAADHADYVRLASRRGRMALAAAAIATAMAFLDGTLVNVALRHIAGDFHARVADLQWIITGYLLSLASLILLGGALGDRYGRRKIFVIGTVWFAAASLLCGLAPSLPVLVAARVLQGVGGALLTPGSLALLQAAFHPDDRAAAVGAWSGLGGIAGAIGPLAGGWIVDGPGWRWAFLINVPLAAGAVVCSRALPESRDPTDPGRFDGLGTVLAVVGLIAVTWSLNQAGRHGFGSVPVAILATVGIAALGWFVAVERRVARPLVPPTLFASRLFTVLNLATFTLYGALGAVFFLLVYQLQVSAHWTALEAGSSLLPATAIMLVGSARSGRIAQRHGPRTSLVLGPLLIAAAVVWLGRIHGPTRYATAVLPGAILFGLGLVTFVAPLTAAVMATAPEEHVAIASGVNNAVARTANLAAVAAIPVIAGLANAAAGASIDGPYRRGMMITAALAGVTSLIAAVGLRHPEE